MLANQVLAKFKTYNNKIEMVFERMCKTSDASSSAALLSSKHRHNIHTFNGHNDQAQLIGNNKALIINVKMKCM